jgi:hypothetical protein
MNELGIMTSGVHREPERQTPFLCDASRDSVLLNEEPFQITRL